ncbi:S8 family serine peptidase [Microbulbifer sp. EKSA005]|uniref:S8 family serine peptidase n=1 Tax=Microbulbifer sp. EKSA005 TaxID=3243364 RepID=UPI004040F599
MSTNFLKLAVPLLALITTACGGGGSGGDGGSSKPEVNQAPLASFTLSPESGLSPAVVTFDASASSDSDGSINNYHWDFGDGNSASGKDVEHTFYADDDTDQDYTIKLTVTDNDGATDTAEITFTALKNSQPVAKFSYSQPDAKSRSIKFDASESTDVESSELLYTWDFGDGNTGEGVQPEHEYQENGEYEVRLVVDDQTGLSSEQSITVVVSDGEFTVSGQLTLSQGVFADTDTNDSNTEHASNSSMNDAQPISSVSKVSGFVTNTTGSSSEDLYDFYVTALKGDQEIFLHIQDWTNSRADIDLYLIDESGTLVDSSLGVQDSESIQVPVDGTYYIAAYAYSGASAYRIRLSSAPSTTSLSDGIRTNDNFVTGQLVAHLKKNTRDAGIQALNSVGAIRGTTGADRPMLLHANQAAAGLGLMTTSRAASDLISAGIKVPAGKKLKLETIDALKRLHASGQFEYVELNRIRHAQSVNDPLYSRMWHYSQIAVQDAWTTSTGTGAIVAVLDTGILSGHPDMQGQLVAGYDMISDSNMAVDGDGIDPNPEDPGDDPGGTSDSWHGTHVAGTIAAATNNGVGIAGVAYDAKIMPVRVLGSGGGSDYDIAQGIYFAAGLANDSGTVPDRKADVINMSLGGWGYSQTMQDAVSAARAAGVIVVAAAGNAGSDATNYSPAGLDGVVTVAATREGGEPAWYTNYGSVVDVTAPGGETGGRLEGYLVDGGVISTVGRETENGEIEFTYTGMQGTSMAAPHVAGVIALMKEEWEAMTPDDFDGLVTDFKVSYGETPNPLYGYGEIDAELAVASARAQATGSTMSGRLYVENGHQRELWTQTELDIELLADTSGVSVAEVSVSDSWLSATYLGEESSGLGSYRVAVDTDAMQAGRYTGTVSFTASTDTRFDLWVSVQVISEEVASDSYAGAIYVEFVDVETGEAVGLVMATYDPELGSYSYTSPPLDATSESGFGVMAGTDVDNDGVICEIDELCQRLEGEDGWDPVIAGPSHMDVKNVDMELGVLSETLEEL